MPKVLALDFDGVISNSLLESYLITWRVAGRFDKALAAGPGLELTTDNIRRFSRANRDHWNRFQALVPFGNRAEDYLVIHKAVMENRSITSQEQFKAFRDSVGSGLLDRFHEEFYLERYSLAEKDFSSWVSLNAPYPGVPEALAALAERFSLCIVTSKDSKSVRLLLARYGADHLFGPQAVLDKSSGASKRAHLGLVRGLFDCGYREISFVDDKVSHLMDCESLGVNLLLAGWGYNGRAEREMACRRGYPVLTLEEFPFLKAPEN